MTTKPIIPDAALADCVAIIGRIGAGKSYTARGLAERVLDQHERLCVIDPTGVWWGLRLGPDGKKAGYNVVVFGGDYADVKIGEHSGAPLAELIASRNLPCVLDVSEFTIGARTRFLTAFLETLYIKNPKTPLTLVVDEADIVAPQRIQPDQTVMFSRLEQIVRRGRVRGFRPWLITQRPAELHKSVLSQAATLIALKLTSPQDRKAAEEWVLGHGDKVRGKEVLASLATLQRGEGWAWHPGTDLLARVIFPKIKTYDSMRTPEVGSSHPAPAQLSEVDLSAIQDGLKAVEAEATANDPRKLKERITELERAAKVAAPSIDPRAVETAWREGHTQGYAEAVRALVNSFRTPISKVRELSDACALNLDRFASGAAKHSAPVAQRSERTAHNGLVTGSNPVGRTNGHDKSGAHLGKAERLILTALAQHPQGRSKTQVAVLTGYAVGGGAFNNALGSCRSKGWLTGGSDRLSITGNGHAVLGSFDPLPHGEALLQHWLGRLGKAERLALDVLVKAYPSPMSKQEIADATDYEAGGGAFNNALGRLRTLELINGRGEIRASDDLFS